MAPPPSHSQSVLPNSQILSLERIDRDENGFTLEVRTCQKPRCQNCGEISRSQDSHYRRQLQDLPWQGLSVRIRLKARRFRCRNPACGRKVFVERLPEVALPHARQTVRLADIVRLIGFVVGGLPGSRLLARLAIAASNDTVLGRVKKQPLSDVIDEPIHTLGSDDWAWRKGQDYGRILVDLERHRVADLLPRRSAEELAEWLAQHPTISVISRDRFGLYAEGAQLGAPNSTQVADRFHLVVNMSAAIERALEERSSQLLLPAPTPSAEEEPHSQDPSATKPTLEEARKQQRRQRRQRRLQRRLQRYDQVVQLHRKGLTQKAISQTLQIERKTIRRWLRNGHFPQRKRPVRKPAKVHDFADYLQRRWTEGCHNATKLFQEMRSQGYRGQCSMLAKFVSVWRTRGPLSRSDRPQRFAPKQVAILTSKSPDRLTDDQRSLLNKLSTSCPELPSMRALALDFRDALASKNSGQMLWWIQNAKQCGIGSLVRFAFGLQKDPAAVLAAVETPWSNGQVEGQVNCLKTIKRQM
jgi:transposase